MRWSGYRYGLWLLGAGWWIKLVCFTRTGTTKAFAFCTAGADNEGGQHSILTYHRYCVRLHIRKRRAVEPICWAISRNLNLEELDTLSRYGLSVIKATRHRVWSVMVITAFSWDKRVLLTTHTQTQVSSQASAYQPMRSLRHNTQTLSLTNLYYVKLYVNFF